jgi:transcriptional regulator with XRE-family HTH domain
MLMQQRGLSAREVAAAAQIHEGTVYHALQGDNVTLYTAEAIADALGASLDALTGRETEWQQAQRRATEFLLDYRDPERRGKRSRTTPEEG